MIRLTEEERLEGRKEKAIEVAKKLLKAGVAISLIVEGTGLSLEEVETLRDK